MSIPLNGSTYEDFELYMSDKDKEEILEEQVSGLEDMDDDARERSEQMEFARFQYENQMHNYAEGSY